MRISSMIAATTASLLVGANAQALVLYDDAVHADWELAGWYTQEQSEYVYEGTSALGALGIDTNTVGNGQYAFNHPNLVGGHTVQEGDVLTFYMNTQIDLPVWVQGYILSINNTQHHQLHAYVDGVLGGGLTSEQDVHEAHNNAHRINIDGDSSTWQKVEVDLTQLRGTWTGVGTVITRLAIIPHWQGNGGPGDYGQTIGENWPDGGTKYLGGYTVIDSVSIVPEPASFALLSIGGLALAARRRRAA